MTTAREDDIKIQYPLLYKCRHCFFLNDSLESPHAHRNSNGSFVTLSEPICRKVILGCPFTITYLLLIGTEVIDLLYARVPKYHFDLPFLPCATYLLDPNYLNSGVRAVSPKITY